MPTWSRTITIALGAMTAGKEHKLDFMGTSKLDLMVLPGDLDAMGHMNNGRYLTLQDLGRIDLLMRSGIWQASQKRKWTPLIGGAMIRYKKSLEPFDQFTLHTKIAGWDEKWFYFDQKFIRKDIVCALSLVKGLFRGQYGNIPAKEVVLAGGGPDKSPPLPESVQLWNEAECGLS